MNLVEPYESCACWFSYLNWNEMCCIVGGPRWTPWRAQISKSHLSVVNFDLLSKMKYIWKTPINICVCWFSFIIEIYLLIMNPQETCYCCTCWFFWGPPIITTRGHTRISSLKILRRPTALSSSKSEWYLWFITRTIKS